VLYRGTVIPAAQVRRLETEATLAGLRPSAPAGAHVLEIGCGTGANLLPLALEFPGAAVVGCDLARGALDQAAAMAGALGLANLDLRHADLRDIDDGWGIFDYIVCHDVFSWVAPRVRRRILQILARQLAPHGVAYLSCDALPGWHLHTVARDMMRCHTRGFGRQRGRGRGRGPGGPQDIVDQARAMLALAAQVQDQGASAYAALVRDEYSLMSSIPDEHLVHLVTEPHHRADLFSDFIDEIGAAGLQWLGDAAPAAVMACLPPAARALLQPLPVLQRQQYLDFLNNCSFRQAVLCRADAPRASGSHAKVSHADGRAPAALRSLWFGLASAAKLSPAAAPVGMTLRTGVGALRVDDAAMGEALSLLEGTRPEAATWTQLFGAAHEPAHERAVEFIVDAIGLGAIDAVLTPFSVTGRISRCPSVSALARLEARSGSVVTNQKSEPVRLGALMRFVVQRLDGRHDEAALGEAIAQGFSGERDASALERALLGDSDPAALAAQCLREARDRALLMA
jgi:SAM-dependent methyltransferase